MIIGAGLTAAFASAFAKTAWPNVRHLKAVAFGGVLMGIGVRLCFGCNIRAFVAGTASGNLRRWIWFALSLAGSFLVLVCGQNSDCNVMNTQQTTPKISPRLIYIALL